MAAKKFINDCIKLAFLQLLSEKDYNQVTISEITEKAGVARTSFYRMYNSKDDLLNEIKHTMTSECLRAIEEIVESDDYYKTAKEKLNYTEEQKKLILLLNKANAINYAVFAYQDSNVIKELTQCDDEKFAKTTVVLALYTRWITNNLNEDSDTLARSIAKILTKLK